MHWGLTLLLNSGTSIVVLSTFLLVSTGFALCSAFAIISVLGERTRYTSSSKNVIKTVCRIGVALLAFLAFAVIGALFVTGTAVGTYLAYRLLFHIRSQLSAEGNGGRTDAVISGLKGWTVEVRVALLREVQFITGARPAPPSFADISDGTYHSKEEDIKPVLSIEEKTS